MNDFLLFDFEEEFNGLPAISINDVELLEGDDGLTPFRFTVSLSQPSEETVIVDFATQQNTASERTTFIGSVDAIFQDFNPASGSLEFTPGETEKTIVVDVIGDRNGSSNGNDIDGERETFFVELSNPQNAVFDDNTGTGTIVNDELLNSGDLVYGFFNREVGSHFYTSSEVERDFVRDNLDNYIFEGDSFRAAPEPIGGDRSEGGEETVFRFYNTATGGHFYTISELEKDFVLENLPQYQQEIGFFGYESQPEGTIPLYRFYNLDAGTHFYTPSVTERDFVLENLPSYRLEGDEGIAFYILPTTEI